jgi:hypothetical protein
VRWERGLLNEALLDKYTLAGRKDPITGQIDLLYSLRHLLAECRDFKEEETALQYLGSQTGVTVQLTPKFPAELAGEGVEYCWAQAKSHYRRVPVSRKRGRENFKQLVRECTHLRASIRGCDVNTRIFSSNPISKFRNPTKNSGMHAS